MMQIDVSLFKGALSRYLRPLHFKVFLCDINSSFFSSRRILCGCRARHRQVYMHFYYLVANVIFYTFNILSLKLIRQ